MQQIKKNLHCQCKNKKNLHCQQKNRKKCIANSKILKKMHCQCQFLTEKTNVLCKIPLCQLYHTVLNCKNEGKTFQSPFLSADSFSTALQVESSKGEEGELLTSF